MRYVALIIALALLFGCASTPPVSNSTQPAASSPVMSGGNTSGGNASLVNLSQNLSAGTPLDVATFGDQVWVNYTLLVNGTVFDTNNITLARQAGIYDPTRTYDPLTFNLSIGQGVIPGFVLNIVGMKLNETSRFTVQPAQGYGPYDPTKVYVIPLYYNTSLFETVPLDYFTQRNLSIENGTAFNTSSGLVTVQGISGDNVTLFYFLQPGQTMSFNGVPTRVVSVDKNLTAELEFDLDVNKTYELPNPQTGVPGYSTILNKTNSTITVDFNHPLAGKTLDFEVTLLKIVRPPS